MPSDSTQTNGMPPRKTLAAQLDRLDNIIDAMADGLPRAIADAVCQAIGAALPQAIQAVITQVLSQPEVARLLAGLNAPATEPPVGAPDVVARDQVPVPGERRNARSRVGERIGRVGGWVRSKLPGVRNAVHDAGRKVWRHRHLVAVSLAVGVMVGCTGYTAGPVLSSIALGVCGAAASAGAYLASPFVRLWKSMQPQDA